MESNRWPSASRSAGQGSDPGVEPSVEPSCGSTGGTSMVPSRGPSGEPGQAMKQVDGFIVYVLSEKIIFGNVSEKIRKSGMHRWAYKDVEAPMGIWRQLETDRGLGNQVKRNTKV